MMNQEQLRDLTESYLKSVFAEASEALGPDFDAFAPFGELGIDSFRVLKIIKALESDFGTLPKSLLFENFNIHDLTNYFVRKHAKTLSAKFGNGNGNGSNGTEPAGRVERPQATPVAPSIVVQQAAPILILEKDAYADPELKELVRTLFDRYRIEGSVSRGTRKIAPNLFIGSARCGYFNYARSGKIMLVYAYTGPWDYFQAIAEEMYRHCEAKGFQLNFLTGGELPPIGGTPFSATPFGILQRIVNLKEFSLDGGPMRRLRYQVTKFLKSGKCRTEEYQVGSNSETATQIADIIDRWCATRTMVNPLVHEFRAEILAGTLAPEHRVFVTYLDDVLQNAILVTSMENGYLMDLEFYPPEMPLGGLEYAIIGIIERLVAEGCDVLSLGGTYGCKLEESSEKADPELDKILDELRARDLFNDAGNLQFKNKFRPENHTVYLCRPVGAGNADNVIDIIMMIADPEKLQTSDAENHNYNGRQAIAPVASTSNGARPPQDARTRALSESGFNPLNIAAAQVDFDLKTDSWAQLEMAAIDAQMAQLHRNLQQPVVLDDTLRTVFPFAHFVLTGSGQAAEHIFFKAWPKKGRVPQNLLFPSTIFHQIDNGFTPVEIPHPAVFQLDSEEMYKGNVAWDAFEAELERDHGAIALVCIEVSDNAAGGCPVSLQHLRSVKARLAAHSIPLVIDATRVVENAQFLIERDPEQAGKNVWAVVREILSCADAVIGSLTKDFCVNKGGIIATNDAGLFQRMQELVDREGTGLELIEKKAIALAVRGRKQIETKVARRMEGVRQIWEALKDRGVPVAHPAGGHCVLIDVKQLAEFAQLADPVASFVAWLYLNTGIRAGAHSVGMQKRTTVNDLVRLAIPVGLKPEEIDGIVERLVTAFAQIANIPEVVMERGALPGGVHAIYKLVQYHRLERGSEAPAPAPVIESVETPRHTPEQTAPAAANGVRRQQDIAIVGMAGRYPKSKTLRELWDNLAQGRDCITEIPADRYEWRVQHGSTAKYRGGFIDDVDKFDSLFFNVSPREAEMLDPQERQFLEVAWEAIEDAGYHPDTLALEDGSRKVGVFVGAVWAMYQMLGVEEKHAGNFTIPNSFLWSVANRVSYCLNLSGPSLTVDTACSSSLTALYLACEAIYAGRCSAAIVGGVNLDLHQARFDINHTGGALSPDGVCRTFGTGANGYVMGEGIGALYLKPLDRAVQDRDHIYGVIKSALVNHGGRTSGYTVPNPKAQAGLIVEALEQANVPARTIGYIEAHGTGTALGDPVEITGLTDAFSADAVANQSCAIGSIKTNIGHAEAAAGVVSVTKVLLQMKQRQIAPSLHSSELSEFIDFANSPFYVPQQLQEWKEKEIDGVRVPLRAGISSFGAGGSNAHIVLESYEPTPVALEEQPKAGALIFPLSAKTEEQLREAAFRLADFLRASNDDLRDVAHTLKIGRKSFDQRVVILAETKEELLEKLTAFVTAKKSDDVIVGQAKNAEGVTRLLNRREKEEFVRILSESGDPRKVPSLWADGLLSDWQGYEANGARNKVSLPTYPFADKRHWAYQRSTVRRSVSSAAAIHPMLDSNESTFERQLFRKTFNERDFFIYDHLVSDIPTLPGVAYLELARKAGELAAGRKVRKIKNILWLSPIAVQNSAPKEVLVELRPSDTMVRFEVFSNDDKGVKTLHSQGTLHYETQEEAAAEPESIDIAAIRARTAKVTDGATVYPRFKAFGLNLGPSFQVLQDVYKGDTETLGVLKLPEFREADLQSMMLPPSLVDGSLQAGVAGVLTGGAAGGGGEMYVPYSIGEVEILSGLVSNCFSYVTQVQGDKKGSRVARSNVLIVDETGKVLVKIRDSVGVPLGDLYSKPAGADADEFSKLYYGYDWEKAPLAAGAAPQNNVRTLVFDTNDTLRAGLGGDVLLVQPGEAFADSGNGSYTINPRSKDDFARLIGTLVEQQLPVDNICFAWPLGESDSLDQSLERGVYPFLYLCQALIQHKLESAVQLLYVHPAKPEHEAIRGFINALRLELSKLLCKAVEVGPEGVVEAVVAEMQARTQDAVAVRYEGQERSIKKLKAFELEETEGGASIRENGVYLITGGVGGLGLIFAEYLAKEHKAKLVLTGRSALTPEREAKLEELRNAGAEVLYLAADVSKSEDIANVVSEAKSRFGALHGVIHAAGVLRDAFLRNKTAEEMSAVFAPKLYGTLNLDEATKNEALDFFVTFSSLASVAGNAGQSDYSFANHFMDAFAARRTGSGKTLSINWSIWADGGMQLDEATAGYFKKNLGISPLSAAAGLNAFVGGLASSRTQFVFLEGVQDKVELAWGLRKKEPAPAPAAVTQTESAPAVSQADSDLQASLIGDLTKIVVEFLKLDAEDVATDQILMDLGFDSIGLTSFANAVNDKFGTDITPVLFFDYPSLNDITKYLCAERESEIRRFYGGSSSQPVTTAAAASVPSVQDARIEIRKGWNPAAVDGAAASRVVTGGGYAPEDRFINEPIAIVGISGVMPQSDDVDEFWDNLQSSTPMVTLIPPDRWSWEAFYGDPLKEPNKTYAKWGAFMREVDKFDPLFFGISPREAEMMDPQQRIFLETVWKAVEDSGQKVSDLSGTKTGLFVGAATNDYIDVLRGSEAQLDGYSASGNSHSVLANRVSFLLNLHGPSAPLDTACSSSLVALHRAIESIHTGSSEMAIVGGIQVMLTPAAFISFAAAGMLSPDGKCKTFDKSANGYVRGEGSGAIFIKKLSAALADGNHIYAVIRATAENHGGKATMLTAPNSAKQADLLVEAYEKGHVDPATVGFIECHGTGTSLGDPIEIQALTKAFTELYKRSGKRPETPHIGLSSVKTNIGHLETAAGIAGILKTLLALKHKQIPANAHFQELNPYINLTGTPFYIADKLTPWAAPIGQDGKPAPRRAGVSSFGFGGANAHIVLEEYTAPSKAAVTVDGPQLIVLSAKNDARLKAYARSLVEYLDEKDVELTDLAYTLQVGRDEMPERLAVVVSNRADLKQKLNDILNGATPADCYHANANSKQAKARLAELPTGAAIQGLAAMAEVWVSGGKIDWKVLYKAGTPKRISAPTYPFARERYWVQSGVAKSRPAQAAAAVQVLHPLVHRNTSTLQEQKFSSRFSGEEFFLADHVVQAQKILPGVAYMEIARAAGELAANTPVRIIRGLTWERPLVVDGSGKDVDVVLTPVKNEIKFAVRSGAGDSALTHCTGRLAYQTDDAAPEVFDVAAIKQRCTEQVITGKELYPFLSGGGLELGRSFQIVQTIHATERESLAVLQLPEHLQDEAGDFWLHPALMDGSLHTAIGLMKKSGMDITLGLPYSVGEVEIFHPVRDLHYGYATWPTERPKSSREIPKATFHLLDKNGRVLVRMKDFVSLPVNAPAAAKAAESQLQSLVPVWSTVRPSSSVPEPISLLLLGDDQSQRDWLGASYPGVQSIAADAAIIEKELGGRSFDQLVWIAPDANGNDVVAQQEAGVLSLFRIIKSLQRLGYAGRKLQWTFVLRGTQRVVEGEPMQPTHAAVVGLVGSLAKECPQWDLRVLDVDSLTPVTARECLSLPWDKQGDVLAHRKGEWFQQKLAVIPTLPEASPAYRQNGVYVVIGGAGGVGEVWSRFMIEKYQANIVWIGRRELDASIEKKIDALAQIGPAPLYIAADATNPAALEQACKKILEAYPAIHGVVHSAIVLQDQSLARMDEATFRASLSAKLDISVNIDRVFGAQALDCMMFFSSVVSFVKSPGQSNYAAGCTFKDSFAHDLQQRRPYPVKVMNWGYWGNVGIVADEVTKKTMAQMGIGSIEAEEGMAALQVLAGSGLHQMALIKTLNNQTPFGLPVAENLAYHPQTASGAQLQVRKSDKPTAALESELPSAETSDLVTEMLASTLIEVGFFRNGVRTFADLSLDKPPAPYFERWLQASIRHLQQQNVLSADLTLTREVKRLADLWSAWESGRSSSPTAAHLEAQGLLLETCLKALPAVLTGKQPATEVLFPNSSMHLVEGIYRGSAVADRFNEVLSETVIACIEQRLAADPQREIRIIEIGAGTGGTTAGLLPILKRYPIAEYCYTDISRAFLMVAEKQFKAELPALTTAVFDVTRPLTGQSIAAGQYDFAIAANVLHATPDIRETLRNTKAALKNGGVLLLNEIANWSVFNHLTFGLLEGWWLPEDTAIRLPGSPGLATEKWQETLAEEGFEAVQFPAENIHRFGQQIVVAASNGWTRQRIVAEERPSAPAVSTAKAAAPVQQPAASAPKAAQNEQRSLDHVRQMVTEKLSEALHLDVGVIRSDAPFAEYGVDSIVGVNFVRSLGEGLQVEIEPSRLFEYSTVDELSGYIMRDFREQIAAQLPADNAPAPVSAPVVETPVVIDTLPAHRFAITEAVIHEEVEVRVPGEVTLEPIAIIGMSGRFSESESLDAFWQHLAEGHNLVKKVTRWDVSDCVMPGTKAGAFCSHGSFIDSFDRFDPAFFGLTAEEAVCMDPQQRLFLEESWKALEDAGYAGKDVHDKTCGVYVGCGSSNYDRLGSGGEVPAHAFWGNSQAVIPARIAYHLNLHGPAISVDTACSSSLVTIHLACQGLWSQETEMALAGGVFIQATSGFYQVANRAGMLSPDGKVYSFDARANGFVPGEGVGVVVLKRLRDAVRDRDHIHGVISASGLNQDGRSNGLIAPNGRAQEQLERAVYDRFDIHPESIQVVEAHATGTPLGDSIEYAAIARSFRGYTDKKQFCALGTVKTNIGHAATAAGVAGVLKVLLSLKHRQIPPTLNFEKANPALDFENGPFYVNTQLREWAVEGDAKRRAAVSSFGFSGTNAHLIVEEAPAIAGTTDEAPAYLVALSARTSEQLQQHAQNLLAHLERTPGLSMTDASFSLLVGRVHLDHRLACVARNQDELIRLLQQWIATGSASQVYAAETQERRVREQVALKKFGNHCIHECRARNADSYTENLSVVAELFVQGYSLDYPALFAGDARRIPLPTYPFARERYWMDGVPATAPRRATAVQTSTPQVASRTTSVSRKTHGSTSGGGSGDLRTWLQNELTQTIATLLNLRPDEVSTEKVLVDLGFDSLGLTDFANTINQRFELDLTPVMFFDYPSVSEIAKYLAVEREADIRRFQGNAAYTTQAVARIEPELTVLPSAPAVSPDLRFINEPIAIVGIAGVMPQCDDLDALWANLRSSKDLVTVIPEDRWDWEDFYGDPLREPNKSNSKWGGFMNAVDKFDPLFFGISPREAQMMDPQQRIFLQTVWKAIEDSGQKASELAGTRTGLFVGVGSHDYVDLLHTQGEDAVLDGYTASGNSHSVLANRVSFLLNLRGPSAPIDTACSSSLVALHRAIESIHSRSCDMAIVGGVQVILSPAAYISFGMSGMLSSDGKCKAFDKRANGYVRGEGCGAMLLKPLSMAEADGNHIHAVIRATSENHGGRVTSMTAPNSAAQAELVVEAYERAQIDPTTVGYIECHGTGTSLGDPIEVRALSSAFSELYKRHGKAPADVPHCGLGTVKTNIGHLETAAGIAGLLKVLLALKHKELPANAHFEELNPYITLKGTPFYVVDKLTPWEAIKAADGSPLPRRASVSSFGFGGANAHAILEEYVPAQRQTAAPADEPQLIVLSAKNEDRLRAYVESMRAFLDRTDVELADLAYTLQAGREEMPERLAVVVSSTQELREKFAAILKDRDRTQGAFRNRVADNETRSAEDETLIEALAQQKELSKLAKLWVSGAKIDWSLLHESETPRRISAPTYPFAQDRYWIPSGEGKVRRAAQQDARRVAQEDVKGDLQTFVPVWNPVRIETGKRVELGEQARILLAGTEAAALDWVRQSYPRAEFVEIDSRSNIDDIARKLGERSFEQLLWIAPDAMASDAGIIDRQEDGVIAVFRTIKALLQLGYGKENLRWTLVTSRTQQVTEGESIQPAHAGVTGLIGSLAKEHPTWDLKVLDVDSLASVTARECLSLPWDKQGNALAHRRGAWFQQSMELTAGLSRTKPVYRKNGVYVVIGGAGGIGEVWSRFMIEHEQANVVWIGRRPYDAAIEKKLNALPRAPLYISADATDFHSLAQARETILKTYPAIHGVVHSALVLHDQSIARMDESAFRAGLSAKVDVSVNMDRVFGNDELDFTLFFSSMVSFLKSAGQSNYSAGCTFQDSFAHMLQQQRPYAVKTMNWGYWGSVGVAADEAHRKNMARFGIGSIEPHEGMAGLQALMNSATRQAAFVKTLDRQPAVARPAVDVIGQTISGHIRQVIVTTLCDELLLDAAVVRNDAPLPDYGVDSIVGVNLVRRIGEALQIPLEPSSLFEYHTVNQLTGHIAANWQEQIAAQVTPSVDAGGDVCIELRGLPVDIAVEAEASGEQLLEELLWQEASLDDSYEKVTF